MLGEKGGREIVGCADLDYGGRVTHGVISRGRLLLNRGFARFLPVARRLLRISNGFISEYVYSYYLPGLFPRFYLALSLATGRVMFVEYIFKSVFENSVRLPRKLNRFG